MIIGAIISRGQGFMLYGFALAGAAVGAGITFIIVSNLTPTENAISSTDEYTSLGLSNITPQNPQRRNDENYK